MNANERTKCSACFGTGLVNGYSKSVQCRTCRGLGTVSGIRRHRKPISKYVNERAREAARYWGAECEANPGTTFSEDYALDCALKYGRKSYAECTSAEKSEILVAFAEGRRAEREAVGR